MMSSAQNAVLIPLINESGHRPQFLTVTALKPSRKVKSSATALDENIAELRDYGFYPAGKAAQTAYAQLVSYWQQQSVLPGRLIKPVSHHFIRVLSKISASFVVGSGSGELGLLLAMLQGDKKLPYGRIYASGSLGLDNETQLPRVLPVENIYEKTVGIIKDIESLPDTIRQQPILIVVPKAFSSAPYDLEKNCTKRIISPLIQSFIGSNPKMKIEVIYADSLAQQLSEKYPNISKYHTPRLAVWAVIPLMIAVSAFWQYQQPLQIQWEGNKAYPKVQRTLAPSPQRARLNDAGQLVVLSPCSQATIDSPLFQVGDILLMTASVNDGSWYQGAFVSEPLIALIGEKSGVRIESMSKPSNSQDSFYRLAFTMVPPQEAYAVVAITQRGNINKGVLNKKLSDLTQGMTGISRLTTAIGYLEQHYDTAQFRFHLIAPEQCENKRTIEETP